MPNVWHSRPLTSTERDALNVEPVTMRDEDGRWYGAEITRSFDLADQCERGYFTDLEHWAVIETASAWGIDPL